jgi:hypothetical protein
MENFSVQPGRQEDPAKKIREYLGRELPAAERRIAEPMRPECKVAICIPAFKERTSLLETLEFLSLQSGVAMNEFETIINVNNRPDANPRDREQNSQLLELLKYITGEIASIDFLSEEEQVKLEKIKASGIVVHYIDKSSPGNEISKDEDLRWKDKPEDNPARCMQPRKRTIDEICERFILANKNEGIIASLDADTKVSRQWIKQIIATFKNKDIQLLAGERRGGLDIDVDGNPINQDQVMEQLLDNWNSEERKSDEAFKELPNIETGIQRAQILLMNQFIGVYNTARGQFRRAIEGKTDTTENFKGGSGKMFRVGTYVEHSFEIIKIMDAGGKPLSRVSEKAFNYSGRTRAEKTAPTTTNPEIEALAVYPETRIRGWDVRSPNPENPYQDFNAIHRPFGSSGKEYAYAIAAVLKEKIPTTYNEEVIAVKQSIENFIRSGQSPESRQILEQFFDQESIAQIEKIELADLEKLRQGDAATLEKHSNFLEKVRALDNKAVSIIDALRFYGQKNPEGQTFNPERYFFGILIKEMIKSSETDGVAIKNKIKTIYHLSDALIAQLSTFKNESDLLEFAQSNPEIQGIVATMPEQLSYTEAANKYEALLAF